MTKEPDLRPATPRDLQEALAFALRFEGRKRIHDADEMMSQITAERLVRHLDRCGFVLMRRPPASSLLGLQKGHRKPEP